MQALSQLKSPRPDTLRWAIFLALLGPGSALAQGGLQAATGPGGTPVINGGHGVPVIDIVAPNAHGLSHNQFLDYNVAKPGVVLNNALQAGQSQLAGALAANPQFQGQAASTILNEVVSRNASLIEGPQEIFGRPADYILANPNGITLNGGSFINTTRAGFVVGTPEMQEQQLKYLDTLNASGALQIDADQHRLRAAENTQETTVQRLAFGGDLRVDSTTGSDLNVRASGKGGSLDKLDTTRTAVPGSLYGQQGIQVQLGSDGRYEGTRIDGGEGNVVIQSGGALALTQATDHGTQSSRQLDGNAWAKGGNRPDSTGGEARGYLGHAQQNREQTQAQVAQIDAKGDVRLSSAGDLLLEGTRIGERTAKVGDTHLESGGRLQVKAATSTQQANGGKLGGGMELAAKTGATQSGALGGHFSNGKEDENTSQAVDAQIASSGKLTVASNAREDIAVHLQGLQVSAEQIALNASNGGLLVEASKNIERRNNLDITAGAGFNLAQGATDTRGLHGRAKVDLDKRDNQTWNANTLRAGHISLESLGDTRLEGASLEAERITGYIGGDLKVASLKDSVDTLTIKADARLSHEKNPQGYTNAASALAGPLGGDVAKKAGPALSKAEPGLSPTFNLDLTHAQRDNVAHQTTLKGSEGIELNVAGNAQLLGARLQSAKGDVALRAQTVTRETLSGSDYRREVSIDASNSPVDLGTAVAQMTKGKGAADGENALDLGLLRTSGYNRNQEWGASVQGKQD